MFFVENFEEVAPSPFILGCYIGRSVALRFAETGVASLILCARTTSELDSVALAIAAIAAINSNIKVFKYIVDITSDAAVRKAVGRLDILINNAGMTNKWDSIYRTEHRHVYQDMGPAYERHVLDAEVVPPSASRDGGTSQCQGGYHQHDFNRRALHPPRRLSLPSF
jgi:NAD(P)-dependent dehydrogenase (short-subunit alcohol dehydrogenase family)